jgi:hypothetical protein
MAPRGGRDYDGRDSRSTFGVSERLMRVRLDSMLQFYARIVASLNRRAAVLSDATVLKRDGQI